MSTMRAYVSVGAVKSVTALTTYLVYGRGEMKETHHTHGTNRVAAMYADTRSVASFVGQARRYARAHSRKNEAYSLVVSPPEGSYDPADPTSMKAMVDDVVEGARTAYPNVKVLAVAHTDGKGSQGCGGKPHVHVVAMNHDLATGKAIVKNRTAPKVREIFNEVGAQLGWAETPVTHEHVPGKIFHPEPPVPVKDIDVRADSARLAATRLALGRQGSFELALFDDVLAARDAATGSDYAQWQKSFRAELKARDITMEFVKNKRSPHQNKPNPKQTQGVVYRRRHPDTHRVRTVKASSLGPQVMRSALLQASRDDVQAQHQRAQELQRAQERKRLEREQAQREAQQRQRELEQAQALREAVVWDTQAQVLVTRNGLGAYFTADDEPVTFDRAPIASDPASWRLQHMPGAPDTKRAQFEQDVNTAVAAGLFTHAAAVTYRDEAHQRAQQEAATQRARQHQLQNASIPGLSWEEAMSWRDAKVEQDQQAVTRLNGDLPADHRDILIRSRQKNIHKVRGFDQTYKTSKEETQDLYQARIAALTYLLPLIEEERQQKRKFERWQEKAAQREAAREEPEAEGRSSPWE